MAQRIIIMGAAGRDFHNFNVFFRDNPDLRGGGVYGDANSLHRQSALSGRTGGPKRIRKAFRS